jgi:NADH-quinone oxidoreductase subunit L
MVNGETSSELLRWIPLSPLITAAVHGLMIGIVRRPAARWVTIGLSCGSVLLSFVLSCVAFFELVSIPPEGQVLVDRLYTWIGAGIGPERFIVEVAFRLDALSAVMCLVVTGVGSLIHVYSVGYMDDDHRDDKGFQRFFCYMNLFTFSMLMLVLGDNLVLMFLGWEGVGLCSYLLIGFWYGDRYNAYCGAKAFIVNRIGDFGFLVAMFLLVAVMLDVGLPASLSFADLSSSFDRLAAVTLPAPFWGPEWRLTNVVGLLLFVAAVGKSAQIPLYVWLPDAMAGPTPVSALIHAATMVTAGVYLVCRMAFLYADAPVASAVIAWTGGLTAFFAATIAVVQTDIKKVLAYSTVSQLGYMFLAAGCAGYTAAIFHLVTHAFFKALLFLAAGAVILAMHHEQDIEKMGGLRRRIGQTHAVFLIGALAIAGLPPFSGFFSKDAILMSAWLSQVPGHESLYALGVLTAGITAFYIFRLHFRVFYGESRAPADLRDRIHEPVSVVLKPLWILAGLSALGGLFGIPQIYGDWFGVEESNSLNNLLGSLLPVADAHGLESSSEYLMAVETTLVAALGAGLAYLLYVRRPSWPARIADGLRGLYQLLVRKYYVDEIYDATVVRPTVEVSNRVLFRGVDAGLIDGVAVNGTARAVRGLASGVFKYLQSGLTQGYVFTMILGAVAIVGFLLS